MQIFIVRPNRFINATRDVDLVILVTFVCKYHYGIQCVQSCIVLNGETYRHNSSTATESPITESVLSELNIIRNSPPNRGQ